MLDSAALRLIATDSGHQMASMGINAVAAVQTVDRGHLLAMDVGGGLHEIDLAGPVESRRMQLQSARGTPWVSFQRLHLSANGSRLFVRTAPGDVEARATGQATNVVVINTATLQPVADVPLPALAFDAVPAPDGSALLTSNTNTQDPLPSMTRLVELPGGRELVRWSGKVVGLQAWPEPIDTPR